MLQFCDFIFIVTIFSSNVKHVYGFITTLCCDSRGIGPTKPIEPQPFFPFLFGVPYPVPI